MTIATIIASTIGMTTVFHKSWIKRNAFGGATITTQCRRVDNRRGDYNVADTDDDVTCKFCRKIIDAGLSKPDLEDY